MTMMTKMMQLISILETFFLDRLLCANVVHLCKMRLPKTCLMITSQRLNSYDKVYQLYQSFKSTEMAGRMTGIEQMCHDGSRTKDSLGLDKDRFLSTFVGI